MGTNYIGERTIIGSNCRIFGEIVHKQDDPTVPWDAPTSTEPSPIIEDNVFVGFSSKLIGGIRLARNSYVCAGTILTKDLPSFHIASGVNNIMHYKKWRGNLSTSPLFGQTDKL